MFEGFDYPGIVRNMKEERNHVISIDTILATLDFQKGKSLEIEDIDYRDEAA